MSSQQWICCLLMILSVLPAIAEDKPEKLEQLREDGLTELKASQDVSIRRGEGEPIKENGIHIKNISKKSKHKLDRIALLRFDRDSFENVRAVGLHLDPLNFSDYNKSMRFRVYGVNDGDEQDEKFTEKEYDPTAEDTLVDVRYTTMIDRKQVSILGTFSTEKDETVLFTSRNLLAFVRSDTNGTVTLVIVRETETGHNSSFHSRHGEKAPRLVMKLKQEGEPEQAEEEGDVADDAPQADEEQAIEADEADEAEVATE